MKHLKLILKTLISNNACVEAARTHERKYSVIAIIFAVLAVFLAVLPNTINSFKKNGRDWINTTVKYDFDTGIWNFCCDITEKYPNIQFKVAKDETTKKGYLDVDQAAWDNTFSIKPTPKDIGIELTDDRCNEVHPYIYTNQYGRAFEVYVNVTADDNAFVKYASYILSNLNPAKKLESETRPDEECYLYYTMNNGKKVKVDRTTSTLIFGKNLVYGYLFRPGSPQASGSFGGDYNHTETANLAKACLEGARTDYKINETMENWMVFFDNSYLDTRWRSGWTSTGTITGVDVGVILFMGLMVWILTRGKNNPFRIYSFWDCQKIAYFASLTPGIISMVLGFILAQMAMMFFILICGVRVMWLSMRTLKPNAAQSK